MRCRCLFTLNASEDWAAYEVGGIVDRLAAYVREQAEWPARRPEGEGTLEESAR